MPGSRTKSKSRSPFKTPPLPLPGDSVKSDLLETLFRGLLLPVIVAATIGSQALTGWISWYSNRPPSPPWIVTALAAIILPWAVIKYKRTMKEAHCLRLGMLGEQVVGQMLERLRYDGYEVFHDFDGNNGHNIDHIIIGPPGVFVIETKARRKSERNSGSVTFDGTTVLVNGFAPDRDPIVQVRAAANEVRALLEGATGLKPFIRPVVLYPGWWVDPSPRDDVWVLNETAFPKFLSNEPVRLQKEGILQCANAIGTRLRATLMCE